MNDKENPEDEDNTEINEEALNDLCTFEMRVEPSPDDVESDGETELTTFFLGAEFDPIKHESETHKFLVGIRCCKIKYNHPENYMILKTYEKQIDPEQYNNREIKTEENIKSSNEDLKAGIRIVAGNRNVSIGAGLSAEGQQQQQEISRVISERKTESYIIQVIPNGWKIGINNIGDPTRNSDYRIKGSLVGKYFYDDQGNMKQLCQLKRRDQSTGFKSQDQKGNRKHNQPSRVIFTFLVENDDLRIYAEQKQRRKRNLTDLKSLVNWGKAPDDRDKLRKAMISISKQKMAASESEVSGEIPYQIKQGKALFLGKWEYDLSTRTLHKTSI